MLHLRYICVCLVCRQQPEHVAQHPCARRIPSVCQYFFGSGAKFFSSCCLLVLQVLNQSSYDGFKSDLWSCGLVLYTMLAGKLAFNQKQLPELIEKIKVLQRSVSGGNARQVE